MPYNTMNPLGSSDPKDLFDNAAIIDHYANDRQNEFWKDRFGLDRLTFFGIEKRTERFITESEQRLADAIVDLGFVVVGDYGPGIEITEYNQVIRKDGELYSLSPSVDLPYSTTGDWQQEGDNFVARGDASLRADLAEQSGADMIGYTNQTVFQRLLSKVYPQDKGAKGDGVNDDTDALKEWAATTGAALTLREGSVYLSRDTIRPVSSIQGNGATILFDLPFSQDGLEISENDIVVSRVVVKQKRGISTNPSDFGDGGGVGCNVLADNVNLSRVSVIDFSNGVQFVPVAGDINSGSLENSFINVPGRGLLVARTEESGVVTKQAKNITSRANRYECKESSLPAGTNVEGLNGILVKWPSEGFKSIGDVIRNTAEHGCYLQGSSMYVENIDVEKPNSAIGDGIKISCPDGGSSGVGRFATLVANGIKVRGYGIGVHGQFRTKNCVLDNLDIDVSGNSLSAQSHAVYFSNPSEESVNLSGKNWNLKGSRGSISSINIDGSILLNGMDIHSPVGEPEVIFGVDGVALNGVIENLRIYSPQNTGNGLYVGAGISSSLEFKGTYISGTLGPLINSNSIKKVSFSNSFYNNLPIGHMSGSLVFSLPEKQFVSATKLLIGSIGGYVMPFAAIIRAISVNTSENIEGQSGYVTISVRLNGYQTFSLDIPAASLTNGKYVLKLTPSENIFVASGDLLESWVSLQGASWGSQSTPISVAFAF